MSARRRKSGLTRIDLLAMFTVLVPVAGLLGAAATGARGRGAATCRNNLGQLHRLVMMYTVSYEGYLPAFWHERWVGEMGLVGKKWGKLPHDLDPRVPTVWDNPVPNPIGGFPVRTGAPFLACPDDEAAWRCDQGCHVSYMGLAKYGWWHRSAQNPSLPMFEYHQIQELDRPTRCILLAETEPATWQHGLCECRWLASAHPAEVLDRHTDGGHILFFDGHVELVREPDRRRISHWEPDYALAGPVPMREPPRAATRPPEEPGRPAPVRPNGKLKDRFLDSSGKQEEKLRELARQGVPRLARLLESEHRMVRCAALAALGLVETEAERATSLLVERCDAKDAHEAHFALIALARRRAREARALIPRFAKHADPHLRCAACFAIIEYRDPTLHPLLDQMRLDADRRVQASARTAKALLERRSQPR